MDKINIVEIKQTMENSYIDYAMSVISQRALPDVRDGLKPVQRRILYAMLELNNGPDKPHRKCARIVGDTMGKFHPHGDSSIYEALVKLAQDFSTRYPLVDGHGNFGSIDGDGAAAMRYTEARLSKISMELLSDINKGTVDFNPNFDETEKEPIVLPSKFPNLLVNGTKGIAVGMATNIPPHNLGEVINGVIRIIDNKVLEDRDTEDSELLSIIKGPDFPLGATIVGYRGIKDAYLTGKGNIRVKSVSNIETFPNGKSRIVISQIPYMVNKAELIVSMAKLVKEKKVEGISDIRDESNRHGIRIVVDIKKDVNPNLILNNFYKSTSLMSNFSVNMLALVNNEPKILNLKQILELYLLHQVEVIRRRCEFELNKAKQRAHILEGLKIALDNIDEVIGIIKSSKTVKEAKENIISKFNITEIQAEAIVEMKLRALAALEKDKIINELKEILEKIKRLEEILSNEKMVLNIIKNELTVIRDKFDDERRTQIELDFEEISYEDTIENKKWIMTRSHLGYVKLMEPENFRNQSRGGKGLKATNNIEDDYTVELISVNSKDRILIFTNKGRIFIKEAYKIPTGSRIAKGLPIINFVELGNSEEVKLMKPVSDYNKDAYMITVTKKGIFRKTRLSEFENINRNGKKAINLIEDDEIVDIKIIDRDQIVFLITKNGKLISFDTSTVRILGRTARGVKGIRLNDDEVVSIQCEDDGDKLLFVSENGYGKLTDISEFRSQSRGGKGLICYKPNSKTGKLVKGLSVDGSEELMIITENGIAIRINISSISNLGRTARGVKLMNIDEDVKIVDVSKAIFDTKEEEDE